MRSIPRCSLLGSLPSACRVESPELPTREENDDLIRSRRKVETSRARELRAADGKSRPAAADDRPAVHTKDVYPYAPRQAGTRVAAADLRGGGSKKSSSFLVPFFGP